MMDFDFHPHKLNNVQINSKLLMFAPNCALVGENVWKFYRYAFVVLVQRKNDPPFVFGRKHVCIGKKRFMEGQDQNIKPLAIH